MHRCSLECHQADPGFWGSQRKESARNSQARNIMREPANPVNLQWLRTPMKFENLHFSWLPFMVSWLLNNISIIDSHNPGSTIPMCGVKKHLLTSIKHGCEGIAWFTPLLGFLSAKMATAAAVCPKNGSPKLTGSVSPHQTWYIVGHLENKNLSLFGQTVCCMRPIVLQRACRPKGFLQCCESKILTKHQNTCLNHNPMFDCWLDPKYDH